MAMKRILILGSGGAGKSTFARQLAAVLKIELIHMDVLYWLPGWREPSKEEWRRIVAETVKQDSWLMDGNFTGSLDIRLPACDTVIFLDAPRLVCIWRVLKRVMLFSKYGRPDMAEGCPERFDWKFMLYLWGYPTQVKPRIQKLINLHCEGKKVVWLKSKEEMNRFLAEAGSNASVTV
jgi:adenylate kinase family enzyme